MRRIIIKILLLGQVLWVFHNGIVMMNLQKNKFDNIESIEVRSGNGILKVVCINFLESMKQVIELSCLATSVGKKKFPQKSEQTQRVNLFYTNSTTCMTNMVRRINCVGWELSFDIVPNSRLKIESMLLLYLWLMFLFLFLYRLRYFFLLARSSVGENYILLLLGREVENPNCFLKRESFIEQLGFFICSSLIFLKTFAYRDAIFTDHRLMKFYTSCKSKISDTLFAKVFIEVLLKFFWVIKTVSHRDAMFTDHRLIKFYTGCKGKILDTLFTGYIYKSKF
jgi:hypothetical protein